MTTLMVQTVRTDNFPSPKNVPNNSHELLIPSNDTNKMSITIYLCRIEIWPIYLNMINSTNFLILTKFFHTKKLHKLHTLFSYTRTTMYYRPRKIRKWSSSKAKYGPASLFNRNFRQRAPSFLLLTTIWRDINGKCPLMSHTRMSL